MRKLFILIGIMVTSLVLVGCGGNSTVVTPPSYTGVRIEDVNPLDGADFVTFYRAKQETLLVEVGIDNPDTAYIKSIVINGITYNSHRFTDASTSTAIYFELNVGSVVGETIYSVDRINYLDGDNTIIVEGFNNNEFEVYVYKSAPVVTQELHVSSKSSISTDFSIEDVDDVYCILVL